MQDDHQAPRNTPSAFHPTWLRKGQTQTMVAQRTLNRWQLGREILAMMRAADWTQDRVASLLEVRRTKINGLVAGTNVISVGDLEKIIKALDVTGDEDAGYLDWLKTLRRDQQKRGFWTAPPYRSYGDRLRPLIEAEMQADLIEVAHSEEVPPLLRTEAYLRARLEHTAVEHLPWTVDEVVGAWKVRQEPLLRKTNPLRYNAVLSESCLTTEYGDPLVMAEMIDGLLHWARQPNVTIQILPSKGRKVVMGSPFALITVPSHGKALAGPLRFLYYNNQTDVRYIDDQSTLDVYTAVMTALYAAALSPDSSMTSMEVHADNYRQMAQSLHVSRPA